MDKKSRVVIANELIKTISIVGRRFFSYKDRISRFEFSKNGKIFFIDSFSQKRIYTHYKGQWRGFSNGGTLKSLIEQLRDYIQTGEKLYSHTFGPWSKSLCHGDLWGYGDDILQVRSKARELDIIVIDWKADRLIVVEDALREIKVVSCGELQIECDGDYDDSDGLKWIFDKIESLKL